MTHRLTNALQQCELPNEKIWPNGRMAKKGFRMAKEGPQCIFPRYLGDTCTGGACSSVRHVTKVHIVLDSTNWQNCDPSGKLKSAHALSLMNMKINTNSHFKQGSIHLSVNRGMVRLLTVSFLFHTSGISQPSRLG